MQCPNAADTNHSFTDPITGQCRRESCIGNSNTTILGWFVLPTFWKWQTAGSKPGNDSEIKEWVKGLFPVTFPAYSAQKHFKGYSHMFSRLSRHRWTPSDQVTGSSNTSHQLDSKNYWLMLQLTKPGGDAIGHHQRVLHIGHIDSQCHTN